MALAATLTGEVQSLATLEPHAAAINRCFSHSSMEAIFAALAAEKEDADWAKATLKTLSGMSPTSMKLTLEGCIRHADPNVSIGQVPPAHPCARRDEGSVADRH